MPRQPTIRVNQGYRIDSKWEVLALVGRILARTARLGWRYRTELGLLLAVGLVRLLAGRHLSPGHAWMLTGSIAATALLWPTSRALLVGRLSCARTRRRLRACMAETRCGDLGRPAAAGAAVPDHTGRGAGDLRAVPGAVGRAARRPRRGTTRRRAGPGRDRDPRPRPS